MKGWLGWVIIFKLLGLRWCRVYDNMGWKGIGLWHIWCSVVLVKGNLRFSLGRNCKDQNCLLYKFEDHFCKISPGSNNDKWWNLRDLFWQFELFYWSGLEKCFPGLGFWTFFQNPVPVYVGFISFLSNFHTFVPAHA